MSLLTASDIVAADAKREGYWAKGANHLPNSAAGSNACHWSRQVEIFGQHFDWDFLSFVLSKPGETEEFVEMIGAVHASSYYSYGTASFLRNARYPPHRRPLLSPPRSPQEPPNNHNTDMRVS